MKYRVITLFILLGTLAGTWGCNETKNKKMSEDTEQTENTPAPSGQEGAAKETNLTGPFFKASGNEPFWNLTMEGDQMTFTSLIEGYEELHTPLPEMQRAADANVKRYRAETEKVILNVTIAQAPCADTMADKEYLYKVTVEVQLTGDSEVTTLHGCGNYQTDQRLNDIWVLEQLGTEKVEKEWFAREFPNMEIDTRENRFSGFAGCNQMTGEIFWENELLRFTKVATTRKACIPQNREGEFLQNLARATRYKIENNRLWLSNPNGIQLVFRKVD